MQGLGKHWPRLVARVLAATTAMAMAITLGGISDAAAVAGPPNGSNHIGHFVPAGNGDVTTESAGGGARSGDFTTDGVTDLLVRHASTGQLRVYPHSGTYAGTSTFRPAITINAGWSPFRWIGQGDMNGDGNADVVYVDGFGNMFVAPHSGTFNGTRTLLTGAVTSTNWQINDLIFTYDVTGDGLDDVLARRAGTGNTYVYENTGGTGTAMLLPPVLMVSGGQTDIEQTMGDFTMDGVPDMLFIQNDGWMGLYDFTTGRTFWLGYGWQGIDTITLLDVNRDGLPDVLGRRHSDGALLAYPHTGTWRPLPDATAYGTLRAPTVIGLNWQINNVIT